jgi:hypothetical protein
MRSRGNRIVPGRTDNGKGSKTLMYPGYQVGLVLGCSNGPLTFKLHTESKEVFTFKLYNGEKFDEHTERFNMLEIQANSDVMWYAISQVDIDARV